MLAPPPLSRTVLKAFWRIADRWKLGRKERATRLATTVRMASSMSP